MDTIPNYWAYKAPIEAEKDVLIFRPIYGPSQTRGFGDGSPIHKWEIGNDDSDQTNFLAIKAFWVAKYPGVAFILNDVVIGEKRAYEFDSNLAYQYNPGGESYSWSVRIKEVYPYVVIP